MSLLTVLIKNIIMKFILYFCLVISLVIITFIYWNLKYFVSPWWVILVMISYLSRTKTQIRKEFFSPIGKKRKYFLITFVVLFCVVIIYSVTTVNPGTTQQTMTYSAKRFVLLLCSILITFAYGYQIGKIRKEGNN